MSRIIVGIFTVFVTLLVPQLAWGASYSPAGVTYVDNTENSGRSYTTVGNELMKQYWFKTTWVTFLQAPSGATVLDSLGTDYHLTNIHFLDGYTWREPPRPKPADRCVTADINESFYAIDTTGIPCAKKPVRGMKRYIRTGRKPKGYRCKHRGRKRYVCRGKGRGRDDDSISVVTGIIDPIPPAATADYRVAWCGSFEAFSSTRDIFVSDRALCPSVRDSMGFYTYAHALNLYGSAELSLISGYNCDLLSDRIDCGVGNDCIVMTAAWETGVNPDIRIDLDEYGEYYYTNTPLCT